MVSLPAPDAVRTRFRAAPERTNRVQRFAVPLLGRRATQRLPDWKPGRARSSCATTVAASSTRKFSVVFFLPRRRMAGTRRTPLRTGARMSGGGAAGGGAAGGEGAGGGLSSAGGVVSTGGNGAGV